MRPTVDSSLGANSWRCADAWSSSGLVLAAMVSVATGGFELRTGKPRSILPDRISGGAERRAARRQRLRGQHAPRPAGRPHAAGHRGPRRPRHGCPLLTWIPGGVPAATRGYFSPRVVPPPPSRGRVRG